MKTKKKVWLISGGVVLGIAAIIGILILASYLNRTAQYKDKVAAITISNVDFTKVADGTYDGECDVDYIHAKVEVVVQGGRVTDIKLLQHENERGTPAEVIPEQVTKQQTLQVNAITGATNSSKVILKAIENALTQK